MRHAIQVGAGVIAAGAAIIAGYQVLEGSPPPKGLALSPLGEYRSGFYDEGAVEISAYDADSRRAFLTFASRPFVQIVDLSDPKQPVQVTPSIDLTPWGGDGAHATSVAVADGVVAVAVPQGEDDSAPGRLVFFDTSGAYITDVTVGALPDMVTFTPNGSYVLTANEGQPNQAYTVDPEGSVSVVDVRGGVASLTQADVSTIGFDGFSKADLDPSVRIYGPGATVAQDLEPEYITVSHDSRTAWVTLQENNALAIIDLKSRSVTAIKGLGFKDHSVAGQGLDGSIDNAFGIGRWPVRGMYQPDGIASFQIEGKTYLITVNEGDVREYAGLGAPKPSGRGDESIAIKDLKLDPTAFPNAAAIKAVATGIGNLKVSSFMGNSDGDGDYEALYTFGARSFSILAADGRLVFDSGDALEQITGAAFPRNFNASNTSNAIDNRSDDKGPEPEGVTVARLFGRQYAFVALERIGGIVVYELTTPNAPRFVQYINTRDFSQAPNSGRAGDLGPEASRVIPAEFSPNGKPLLLVSHEVSGSLRVYEIAAAK